MNFYTEINIEVDTWQSENSFKKLGFKIEMCSHFKCKVKEKETSKDREHSRLSVKIAPRISSGQPRSQMQ